MSHNLPNGIPPQMGRVDDKLLAQTNYSLNGLGSSHSSRDHSPQNVKYNPVVSSQLPPFKTSIPSSQLPPSTSHGSAISQLTKNYSQLSVSNGNSKEVTPFSSPGLQKFATSTPNLDTSNKTLTMPQQNVTDKGDSGDKQINFPQQQNVQNISSKQFDSALLTNQVTNSTFQHAQHANFGNSSVKSQQKSEDINALPQKTLQQSSAEIRGQFDANKQIYDDRNNQQYVLNSQKGQQHVTAAEPIMKRTQFNQAPLEQKHQMQMTNPELFRAESNVKDKGTSALNWGQGINQAQINTSTTFPVKPPLQHHLSQPQISMPVQRMQPMQPTNIPLIQSQKHSTVHTSAPNVSEYSKPPLMQGSITQQPPQVINQQQSFQQPPSQTARNIQPIQSGNNNLFNPTSYANSGINQSSYMPTNQLRSAPNNQTFSNQTGYIAANSQQGPPVTSTSNSQIAAPPNKSTIHGNRYPTQYNPVSSSVQYNQQFNPTTQYSQSSSNSSMPLNQNYSQNFPMQQYQQQQFNQQSYQTMQQNYPSQSITQTGFNKFWGTENYDLLQCPNILPPTKIEPPKISLGQEVLDMLNCNPEIFRCTMTKVPESNSLLLKSRLPLGVLIHPFKDLYHLPVIQCNNIVRCRACRTYINPFVFFIDTKRWKCNICFRVNELPEEFQYDPVSKTYGDPSRRPEVKSSTIEYIAPAEYMLRPPQPAVYLFLLDVSRVAIESGYLQCFCNVLSSELSSLPGDARTQIGFLAYNSSLHFYSLGEGFSQPHEMVVLDIDDVFLPCPENLLVNLNDRMELITDLLADLPTHFNNSYDNNSALGAALQAAHKMISATGGRITVFQAALPTVGPGALTSREDPSQRASSDIQHLNPATDFYKRMALECSGQQIAVDLFMLNSQYVDLATLSGISRFSGGCIYHFPLFKAERILQATSFERSFRRYLTRKIGFEAVMRIRCTRGLSIHTFYGNFFVRSTDLLSLPNVNPDSGFGMQVTIEENLSEMQTVCFQAALLYTSSKGERRIRVHTICLPVVSMLSDVMNSADQQCIVGLLAKMAVDKSMQNNLSDAREAFINAAVDILSSYKLVQNVSSGPSGLLAPQCLRLLPLYISAILKHVAFRIGTSTRIDDRIKGMCDMKVKPLPYLIQMIYPDLYPIHNLEDHPSTVINEDEEPVPMPPHLQLSARNIDSNGAYLMDTGEHMIIIVGSAVNSTFLNQVLGIPDYNSITDAMHELPVLENLANQRLHSFINYLNDDKPFVASLQIIRDNSPIRGMFLEKLIEDRNETALSYHEFLQHLKTQFK